jgi:hypothetical protein
MRRSTIVLIPLCYAVAAVAACAKSETPAADTTTPPAAVAPPAPPPAALTLGDVAGKWNMRAVPDSGSDTTATNYVLTAAPDSAGWTIQYSNGLKVAVHPMVSGDSIVVHAGPYASVRRKGMQVTTDGAFRRQGDKLVGKTTAHYKTARADSVLHLRVEGTKAP